MRSHQRKEAARAVAASAAIISLGLLAAVCLLLTSRQHKHGVVLEQEDAASLKAIEATLPPHWHVSFDGTGRKYYWNRQTATSSWTPPTADGSSTSANPQLPQTARAAQQPQQKDAQAQQDQAQHQSQYVVTSSDTADLSMRRAQDFGMEQPAQARHSQRQIQKLVGEEESPAEEEADEEGAEGDDEAPAEDEGDMIQDAYSSADWPKDLPGAYGDDTSWIVGEHREPLWSDSMTRACGLTEPCEKGRADRGHEMQKTVNPWVDKRRTFDPYAMSNAEGRKTYPWDPTTDPKYYGKGDCSDGELKDECFEKPTDDELKDKKAEWMAKYNEWYTGKKDEDADKGGAKKQPDAAILNQNHEVLPWARGERGSNSMKLSRKHYAGGKPVAQSFKRVVRKLARDVKEGINSFSLKSFDKMEKKFLRARQARSQGMLRDQARVQQLATTSGLKKGDRLRQAKVMAANDKKLLRRLWDDQPLVKAYESRVRDDEQEYRTEVLEQKHTLKQLHKDQKKLADQIDSDLDQPKKKMVQAKHHTDGQEHLKARNQKLAVDHLSAKAADDDLDAYFAKVGKEQADKQ